jgi:putative pyruvate formate lyase activating enzyme
VRLAADELRARGERLLGRLAACDLCPRRCGINRRRGETGHCGVAEAIPVAAALAHLGEEPPLSGTRGAGTVFFGGCNLRCAFCQNRQISRLEIAPRELRPAELAREFLALQALGCHNIELVSPTHLIPQILLALGEAAAGGLTLPVAYNTGGYDALDVLRELDGAIDIYLPDVKYADGNVALELSGAADYWEVARAAVLEMHRQAPRLELDDAGIARRGLIVRHLVLPNGLAGSESVLAFLARLVPKPPVSLMAQFYPVPECEHPLLQRPLFEAEYARVVATLGELGLEEGWVQDLSAEQTYRPDFTRPDPFDARA